MDAVRLLAALMVVLAGCGDNWQVQLDAGIDAATLVCPRLGSYQYKWHRCVDQPELCPEPTGADDDGDGAGELDGDCDDADVFVGPDAAEVCDLRDNDCDGEVDEDGCPPDDCPLSFAETRCCGAEHTIAGGFYEAALPGSTPYTVPEADGTWVSPFEVLLRDRATGELRRATSCPAPPRTDLGYPYRFHLEDDTFVHPGREYDLLIHLRWYFPQVVQPQSGCLALYPVLTTNAETAAECIDFGSLALWCL